MSFTSADQAEVVLWTVRENPRRQGEGTFAYIERIALEAGLMKVGDAVLQGWPQGQTAAQREEQLAKLREQAKA